MRHVFFTLVHYCLGLLLVLQDITIAAGHYVIGGLLYDVAASLNKTIRTLQAISQLGAGHWLVLILLLVALASLYISLCSVDIIRALLHHHWLLLLLYYTVLSAINIHLLTVLVRSRSLLQTTASRWLARLLGCPPWWCCRVSVLHETIHGNILHFRIILAIVIRHYASLDCHGVVLSFYLYLLDLLLQFHLIWMFLLWRTFISVHLASCL